MFQLRNFSAFATISTQKTTRHGFKVKMRYVDRDQKEYILSLNYFLACKRTKPQKNFFFRGWTFFSEAIGRSVVQPRPQAEAIQADRRPRKKISPTKEIKSSSEVSVSFTAAKNHSLEDRYIFFLRYYVSNQAFQDG